MKRHRSSPESPEEALVSSEKRWCPDTDLLTSLTRVLSEIKSTPSTGEISAEVMETFKVLMLQIDELSSDTTNEEGQLVKDESERCLMSWLEDLVAQCEADGELDDIFFDSQEDDEEDDDDALVLALTLEQDPYDDDTDEENVDDDDDDDDDDSDNHTHALLHHHRFLVADKEDVQGDDDDEDDEEIIIVDDDDEDGYDDPLDTQQHVQVMA
ncbi:hypothetical protein BCR42DRAFT_428281 [Absidia repens]|uniref:Uncharacterized protein n=1 Tax=Absidia repens TaxID=90262 RepID=A0A1X2HYR6_9FUNG|nr:hypothetical protein BCR42DRAFT_428281 [Absidia repens]